jgi:hypothetical protein
MTDEPRRPIPAKGATYFPDEGGIMYAGQTFYPADYVATSRDNEPLLRDLTADRDRLARIVEEVKAALPAPSEWTPPNDRARIETIRAIIEKGETE